MVLLSLQNLLLTLKSYIYITTGIIPDDLKVARVVPLYKKKSKINVENYIPISVLSIISKIFERVVFNQLKNF